MKLVIESLRNLIEFCVYRRKFVILYSVNGNFSWTLYPVNGNFSWTLERASFHRVPECYSVFLFMGGTSTTMCQLIRPLTRGPILWSPSLVFRFFRFKCYSCLYNFGMWHAWFGSTYPHLYFYQVFWISTQSKTTRTLLQLFCTSICQFDK